MKKYLLILILFFSVIGINAQSKKKSITKSTSVKLVSMEDFEDNKENYVGRTIKIRVSYDNIANGCQLRKVNGKYDGKWKLWKNFTWLPNFIDPISINIPDKFFENDGKLLPNVIDGGYFEATVYVYNAWNCRVCPNESSMYNHPLFENREVISLELVNIKRMNH